MGDVHVACGILIRCFLQCSSYFLQCTPPSSTFTKFFISFESSLLQLFGCLLGPRSFNSPKGPLARKQFPLPIIFDGIRFISTSTIAPISYLRSWALVTSIISIKFMVDQHPFLLETLAQIDNNTFLFQQHLKAACDLPFPICPPMGYLRPIIHRIDQFLPLAIEMFGCLHKHVDVFLHDYANTIWSLKGPKGLHLFTFFNFFRQVFLIPLQRM